MTAAVTAITLAVSGVVMAVIDDERPVIVRSASDATPFYEPTATSEMEQASTTTTEGETPTTTIGRAQSPTTAGTATVETEEVAPEETPTTTSTPPTTAWITTIAPTSTDEPETPPTTIAPAPKVWVEVARFEWSEPSDAFIDRAVELTGTGRLRVSGTLGTMLDRPGESAPMLFWDSQPAIACPATAENTGSVVWANLPSTDCPAWEGAWSLGTNTLRLGEYRTPPPMGYGDSRWGGPAARSGLLIVEELR